MYGEKREAFVLKLLPLVGNVFSVYDLSDDNFALSSDCLLYTSQISKRTLQRYRSVGALPYKTLGKKTYYSKEDVLTFLSNQIKDFKKEDIAFYLSLIHI